MYRVNIMLRCTHVYLLLSSFPGVNSPYIESTLCSGVCCSMPIFSLSSIIRSGLRKHCIRRTQRSSFKYGTKLSFSMRSLSTEDLIYVGNKSSTCTCIEQISTYIFVIKFIVSHQPNYHSGRLIRRCSHFMPIIMITTKSNS